MKALKRFVLKEEQELNEYEMKMITGGTAYTDCKLNEKEKACVEENAVCTTKVLGIAVAGECRFHGSNLLGSKPDCTCIAGID
ncbi:hypothetical protein [Bacteroides sp.]|uniref:hypothetical protein n=1 Tax=Bacteroides sp. TaxID=29523 RepID=UPI003528A5B4